MYIKEGFFLDKKNSYKNRYYFERNRKTINKSDIKKRDRNVITLILLLKRNKYKETAENLERIITKKLLFFQK